VSAKRHIPDNAKNNLEMALQLYADIEEDIEGTANLMSNRAYDRASQMLVRISVNVSRARQCAERARYNRPPAQ